MSLSGLALAASFALGLTALGAAGCAPSPAVPALAPLDTATWRVARARLAALRARARGGGARAGEPRTIRLALRLREPFTRRLMTARGAVAMAPPDALRMILLGPGGTTALDFWLDGDRFRFAVPAIDLMRRGDASTPRAAMRGLPVDFLRWWLLRPAEGTLLWYEREPAMDHFVLRDGDAIVDLRVDDDGRIAARRGTWTKDAGEGGPARRLDVESVEAERAGCGEVRYRQLSTGLDIAITCEGEEPHPPSPRAFEDPDAKGAAEDEP
jgi:hypothetical protein